MNDSDTLPIIFVTYQFLIPIICAFGILGNVLSVVVLRRKTFEKNVLYVYLRAIALADISYLFCTVHICYMINHGVLHFAFDGGGVVSEPGELPHNNNSKAKGTSSSNSIT